MTSIEREAERQVTLIEESAAEIVPRDELRARLVDAIGAGRPLRVKYGIDPTNPSIHIGHLVPCRLLRRFQDLGHLPVLIVGDYTARVGDPTGRNSERPGLTADEVKRNMEHYAQQLFRVVDESRAEVRYQSEWFDAMTFEETLRTLASFSVAQMLAHETFRLRLGDGGRLSLHELVYPVMQAYDSVRVQADVEVGGTDQRFNCLCGRDLQRSVNEAPQIVVTVPLLPGRDGRKMSKSMDNHVAIDLPADEIVGRVMATPDECLPDYVRLATSWTPERKRDLLASLSTGVNPRDIKLSVAREIARELHGEEPASRAVAEFERVVSGRGVPRSVPAVTLTASITIVELMVGEGLASSRSEARRLIDGGGVRTNDAIVRSYDALLVPRAPDDDPDDTGALLLRVGKRRFLEIHDAALG